MTSNAQRQDPFHALVVWIELLLGRALTQDEVAQLVELTRDLQLAIVRSIKGRVERGEAG